MFGEDAAKLVALLMRTSPDTMSRRRVSTGAMHPMRGFRIALLLIVVSVGACSWPWKSVEAPDDKVGEVRVVVTGLESDDGTVRIGLYDDAKNYKEGINSFRFSVQPIRERLCEWIIADVPYGDYAISLYHDENNNAFLDRNMVKIPNEPYGFSNDAKPKLGMPPYREAMFVLSDERLTLEIAIQ